MAEVAASAPSPSKAAPKKPRAGGAAKPKKEKAPASHPKYIEMAVAALNSLKERSGSSRQAIHKYIVSNYSVGQDSKVVSTHLKLALKRGVETGVIKNVKGTGASGSFKANPEAKKKEKKPKKPKAAKKTKASKPKKAKTESPAKAAKSPSKAKSPKKAAKPAKIAKASKSPAKKTAAKKASPAKPKKAAPKKASK